MHVIHIYIHTCTYVCLYVQIYLYIDIQVSLQVPARHSAPQVHALDPLAMEMLEEAKRPQV